MTDTTMRFFLETFSSGFFKNWFKVEKERRIRKRRSRLEAAVDDAFSLVHRQASSNMAASDVADEVWPTMARSMQKYLRTTRWEILPSTGCPISIGDKSRVETLDINYFKTTRTL